MNLVDSPAWLAYFADEPNAQHFTSAIEAPDSLIVPSITRLEVFKKVAQQRGEGVALQYVAVMQQGHVVALDETGSAVPRSESVWCQHLIKGFRP